MSACKPSRSALARWASDLGVTFTTQPEKQCANGVVYCQLFDLCKPGILNMAKVSKGPVVDRLSSQSNYKLLFAALEKAGSAAPLDTGALQSGNPIA